MSNYQLDFCDLSVPSRNLHDCCEDHPPCLSDFVSNTKNAVDASSWKEDYAPVNFIDDEVMMLIAHWEGSAKQASFIEYASSPMNISDPATLSGSIYEPVKRVQALHAPPKRFFRTFWRSMSRRYLRALGF